MRDRARAERKQDAPRILLPRTTMLDVDGNGRAEVLVTQEGPLDGRSTLSLFRFRADGP
jgi:hypothetical protein